jgi:hypothetical protein
MPILEDRGLFWWNDQRIPKGAFAPSSAVGGTLKVEESGSIRLELDGYLPTGKHPLVSILGWAGQPITKSIQGILKGDAGYVLLTHVANNGGSFKSKGISYEVYMALNCLVSKTAFRPDHLKPLSFRSIKMELAGFEDWLWMGAIKIKRSKSTLTAKYRRERDAHFRTKFGKLSIEYDMEGPYWGNSTSRKLSLKESASIRFSPGTKVNLEECQKYYQITEELLILLTDSDYNLDWPKLTSADGKQISQLYYFRNKSAASPPAAHQCLINFPKIREGFGDLFTNLLEKRERFGPGFYLYLGTRRGMKMFIEHRFVNLIWGLEAFDRHERGQHQRDPALNQKINRILEQMKPGKDKRWLEGQLRHAGEPNLADRLYRIFIQLPLPLDEAGLRKFCDDCAARRNEISHFGGTRQKKETYNTFMRDIDQKSDALAVLYHLHLLKEIGVNAQRLDFKANNNWRISLMQRHLREAGILKLEAGKPTN